MKICKLKLKNLNSFQGEQEIDFEGELLSDASLVAITGPTGAGKTTLLDAICVALYGKTPRLSGTGSQNPNYLISHGEKEGFAEVLFMANGIRYLATWTAKQNGSPKVGLFTADDDKLITDKLSTRGKSLGSSQKTVSEEVKSILGLDFDAFRRSVMLAQGEFAAFLKASDEKRRTILEATAGISIYDVLKRTLNEKVTEVEADHAEVIKELEGIPEASREQVAEAERELSRLQKDAKRFGEKHQQIQDEKQREEVRKKGFEQLQSSERQQNDLLGRQSDIDALKAERELAERAQRLLPEKQAFDTAKSGLEDAEKALRVATTEKTDAEERVETEQADFQKKETVYQTASAERDRKSAIYTDAKIDVGRAEERFAEANKRNPNLATLDNQVDLLKDELADKQTKQTQLQQRVIKAQTFLDENSLPADRQYLLNQATGFLAELDSQEKQLETALTRKGQHEKKGSSLKCDIEKFSKAREKGLTEKTEVETTLKEASAELSILLAIGTRDGWNTRKQKATKVQPIAQKYEATQDDLTDAENRLNALSGTAATLEAELEQIKTDLANQTEVCQETAEVVQRCEGEKESAKWAAPINQLRQHLHTGEPCLVCGATEHPFADVVEPEGEELIQNTESALKNAETEAQAAQEQLQALQTKHIQTEQNKRNTVDQIETCAAEIETLREEVAKLLAECHELYPDTDISSGWISDQIEEADAAIQNLQTADQVHKNASHAYQIVSQQLKTCEDNIERETESLESVEVELQGMIGDIEDLKVDIASTESSFWEVLPETFHGIVPKEAVEQFSDKIEEVAKYQDELNSAKAELKLLDTKIETDQSRLGTLHTDRKQLQTEIEGYRRDGETYLNAVRDTTDGLETETEINAAIDELDAVLKAKQKERDEAQQQLQESQTLLTQKQTTHGHCENQCGESVEKLKTASEAYFDRLQEAEFDSPEAHDNAFRDVGQMQELTDQINAYEDEKQQLEVEITKLRTRFEETPFDPEALARIETQVEEIGAQLQDAQQEVGAQQQKIDTLTEALEKRESLGDEVKATEQELKRWQRLQETIPANKFRDFALEIMFKQMGSIANVQLSYLTSERYQLKVEGIGDLAVIDKWNANEERPVETLSGGESFLTSLALALALADLSRGRAQLNSLFLDEGFGTLDAETLDIAIAALEGLRTQGRSIFLISHIQELTRRLPIKINVRKRGDGSSSIDIRG